jgi:hypothetical protein
MQTKINDYNKELEKTLRKLTIETHSYSQEALRQDRYRQEARNKHEEAQERLTEVLREYSVM